MYVRRESIDLVVIIGNVLYVARIYQPGEIVLCGETQMKYSEGERGCPIIRSSVCGGARPFFRRN
jgi:hypothetical protein